MERDKELSKKNLYDVYYTNGGKKLIVLEGLDPRDQFEPPVLQQTLHQHYEAIAALYWGLFAAVSTYLVFTNIVQPLWHQYQQEKSNS